MDLKWSTLVCTFIKWQMSAMIITKLLLANEWKCFYLCQTYPSNYTFCENYRIWSNEFGLRDWKQRCNAYKVWKKKWEKWERRAFVCKKSEWCRCALVDRSPFITGGFVLNFPFTSVNHVNPEFGNENLWVLIRFTKFPPFSGEPRYS